MSPHAWGLAAKKRVDRRGQRVRGLPGARQPLDRADDGFGRHRFVWDDGQAVGGLIVGERGQSRTAELQNDVTLLPVDRVDFDADVQIMGEAASVAGFDLGFLIRIESVPKPLRSLDGDGR